MRRISAALGAALGVMALSPGCGGNRTNSEGDADAGSRDGSSFVESGSGVQAPSGSPTTCEAAEQSRSYIGCEYWPTVLANNVWNIFDYAVVVVNGQTVEAEITVTGPGGVVENRTVSPGSLTKIFLPWVHELKGGESDACATAMPLAGSVIAKGGAYHLRSTVPVSVFQFNALQYKGEGGPSGKSWADCPGDRVCDNPASPNYGAASGCFSFTNDASLLLPSSAWTGNYRVTGYRGLGDEVNGVGSYFAVVASSDDTTVTAKLPHLQTTLPGAGITGTNALKFTLDRGDVAQIVALSGENHDLSGTLVQADKPVQVLAGTPCSIGGPPGPGVTCDHLEESVFPAETLGKHYFVAPPTSPGGNVVGHMVRFYGNADGTRLTYEPSRPAGCPSTLDAGDVAECDGVVTEAFEVKGDREFAVSGFMLSGAYQNPGGGPPKGDPSHTLATSLEQYRTKYIFLAPDDYDESYVDIIAPDDALIAVDDKDVTQSGQSVGGGYVVIRYKLGPGKDGAHTLVATKPVGIQVMGFGSFTSYHYPGGLDLNHIAPPPVK